MNDDKVGCERSAGIDAALLATLTSQGSTAFAFYDRQLHCRRISGALARLAGRAAEDLLGRRPDEVWPPARARRIEAALTRVLARGEPHVETHASRSPDCGAPADRVGKARADERERAYESQWLPVRDPIDEAAPVIGVLLVVRDITEQRRCEELLRSSQWRTTRLQAMTARIAGTLSVPEVEEAVEELGTGIAAACSEAYLLDETAPVYPWPNVPAQRTVARRRGLPAHWSADLVAAVTDGIAQYTSNDGPGAARAILPLVGSGAPLGVLRYTFDDGRVFDPDDRIFLEAFAGQCALAIERSRLYEREHRTAVALQRSLLPERLPAVRGVEFGFRYLPGAPDFEVGGDWYDVFQLPDGRVAIVVGDVIGKGLTAAAGMGRVRSALRALAFTDAEPAAVLTGLDRLFTATEDDESLTTLVYAVVDPVTGLLDLADAGHLPVVVVSADGKAKLVEIGEESTPLGVAERRTQHTIRLDPGDILIGFSDGLVETRGRGIDEGLDDLVEIARGANEGLEALLTDILEGLLGDRDRDDDVTILGVRITGDP
ncbi:SpoIIE family protein phosphatase [Embleya scabrispora]|uniref:SpoIIE family protein phosphatase n=1 Tax=Embleya scabrispora TaxID=159449 RepID=UPI0003677660|nr:SpoIIE family protein phosphatase [Embleya scabrispora]MYS80460.1 SpoIIE family protein phosphatase [Streptomyces sp. SID5474]